MSINITNLISQISARLADSDLSSLDRKKINNLELIVQGNSGVLEYQFRGDLPPADSSQIGKIAYVRDVRGYDSGGNFGSFYVGSNDSDGWSLLATTADSDELANMYKSTLTPVASIFPVAYLSLITSSIAATDSVYYVDAANGSDTNDGSTQALAFASIDKLNTIMNADTGSATAVILPGEYTITPLAAASSSYIFSDYGRVRNIICAPGYVDLIWTAGTERDAATTDFANGSSNVYGAVFKRNNAGKGARYFTSIVNNTTANFDGIWNNCVFEETNANNNWSTVYDNNTNSTADVLNCTFAVGDTGDQNWSASTNVKYEDCVFNYTWSTSSPLPALINNEVLASNDLDFTTYEGGSVGVYSGTYAWPTEVAAWRNTNR